MRRASVDKRRILCVGCRVAPAGPPVHPLPALACPDENPLQHPIPELHAHQYARHSPLVRPASGRGAAAAVEEGSPRPHPAEGQRRKVCAWPGCGAGLGEARNACMHECGGCARPGDSSRAAQRGVLVPRRHTGIQRAHLPMRRLQTCPSAFVRACLLCCSGRVTWTDTVVEGLPCAPPALPFRPTACSLLRPFPPAPACCAAARHVDRAGGGGAGSIGEDVRARQLAYHPGRGAGGVPGTTPAGTPGRGGGGVRI